MEKKKTINSFRDRFICGDCEDILSTMPDSCIDLVFTSPPYADKRNYGTSQGSIPPDEYVDWFIPKAQQIFRVLKDDGSFILNISDKVVDNYQHLYVFELLLKLCKEVGFHLVRDYIWYNPATPPNVYSRGGYGRTKNHTSIVFGLQKVLHGNSILIQSESHTVKICRNIFKGKEKAIETKTLAQVHIILIVENMV